MRHCAQVPWDVFGVDIVMECSGKFLTRYSRCHFAMKCVDARAACSGLILLSQPIVHVMLAINLCWVVTKASQC